LRHIGRYYVTLINCELVNRANLCLVGVFLDIVKNCPKVRNLAKNFVRGFENMGPDIHTVY